MIVNPGESIQAAIDSLPVEGGIVELAAGTHNITAPIWINKNNITLRGQGIDKTIINQDTLKTDGIIVSTFYDWHARWIYVMDNTFRSWAYMLPWFETHPEELVLNTTIEKLNIYIYGSGFVDSAYTRFAGIGGIELKNLTISEVKIVGTATDERPLGIAVAYTVDVTTNDSIIDNVGEPITYFGVYRGNVLNSEISNGKRFSTIQYNGAMGLDGISPIVRGNRIHSTFGSMDIYSATDVIVTENIIEDSNGQYGGIWLSNPGGGNIISNNIIRNSVYDSTPFSGGISVTRKITSRQNLIIGNIIYNMTSRDRPDVYNSNGIAFNHDSGSLVINDIVASNTIFNVNGNGINNPQGQPITVKNNIIVNNGGYGINNVANHSYNNVWNNTLGNYSGTSPGPGDISADPLFANPAAGDFHLKSQAGRWTPTGWVTDSVTSLCIGAGDPSSDNSLSPWGGVIEMGAYGNTIEASGIEEIAYYVSLSGSDANDGLTEETAWRTITYAATKAVAGDMVIIKSGNYGSEKVIVANSGTFGLPITIKAEVSGGVELVSSDGTGSGITIEGKSYIIIEGIKFTNYGNGISIGDPSSYITIRKCILIENNDAGILVWGDSSGDVTKVHDITITENQCYDYSDKQDYGISISYATDVVANNNYFFGQHHQALSFKRKVYNGVAANNIFEGFLYSALYLGQNLDDPTDQRSQNLIAEENVFRPAPGYRTKTPIWIANVTGAIVRNNYMEGDPNVDGGWGQGIAIGDTDTSAKDVEIHHNIFYKIGGTTTNPAIRVLWNPENVKVYNNVFANCANALGFETYGSLDFRNNIFYDNNAIIRTSDSADAQNCIFEYNDFFPTWSGMSATDISLEPLFVDPTNHDFHLKSQYGRWNPITESWVTDSVTSPCIDAGDPTSDYSNEPQPNGGRINMGAYGNTTEASKSLSATGSISFSSTPSGADIYLDTILQSVRTPATITGVSVGSHSYTIKLIEYEDASGTVTVVADQTTVVPVTLIPVVTTGSISFSSTPSGADIYLDTILQTSKTPSTITDISTGTHSYTLKLTGHNDATGTVTVTANQTTNVSVTLVRFCPLNPKIIGDTTTMRCTPISGVEPFTVTFLKDGVQLIQYTEVTLNTQVSTSDINSEVDAIKGSVIYTINVSDSCTDPEPQTMSKSCVVEVTQCPVPVCHFIITLT